MVGIWKELFSSEGSHPVCTLHVQRIVSWKRSKNPSKISIAYVFDPSESYRIGIWICCIYVIWVFVEPAVTPFDLVCRKCGQI